MDSVWLLKTLAEKVLLPFNEVAKQLRVVGNYWEHFVSFSRKSRAFPALRRQEETVKDAEASSVLRRGETPRSACFFDRSIDGGQPCRHWGLYHPFPQSLPPTPHRLLKKEGMVAFV